MKLFPFILLLVFFGCVGTPTDTKQIPPPVSVPNESTITCTDFCQSQVHAACEGSWEISGAYPNCNCSFTCPKVEENTTTQPPIEEELPELPTTNRTVSQLLDDSLEKLKDDFYRVNSGSFEEKTYTWLSMPADPGNSIPFTPGPASDIEFNSQSIESIRASGFVVFIRSNDEEDISGVAIFEARQTALDDMPGSIDIDYHGPLIDRDLRDCSILSRDYNLNQEGKWFVSYYFACTRSVEK